jgi:hypothetical protein
VACQLTLGGSALELPLIMSREHDAKAEDSYQPLYGYYIAKKSLLAPDFGIFFYQAERKRKFPKPDMPIIVRRHNSRIQGSTC